MSAALAYPEIVTAHLTAGEAFCMLEHAIASLAWGRRHQAVLRAEANGRFEPERRTTAARSLIFTRRKIAALRAHLAAIATAAPISTTPTDLPPTHHEYTSAHVVPGHGTHTGLYAIELLGHTDCWQSGWSWVDPEMAARAGRTLLSRSQRGIGA